MQAGFTHFVFLRTSRQAPGRDYRAVVDPGLRSSTGDVLGVNTVEFVGWQ